MFGLSKKKINPFQIALYLVTMPQKYGIEKKIEEFLEENPEYRKLRNKMLDEIQWIIIACGVIAVRRLSDIPVARSVIGQLSVVYSKIHEANSEKTMFTAVYLEQLEDKLTSYLTRYNRGYVLRIPDKLPSGLEWVKEVSVGANKDFANEAMKYITGETRSTNVSGLDDLLVLQSRTGDEDELEIFIYEMVSQIIPQSTDYFRDFVIES